MRELMTRAAGPGRVLAEPARRKRTVKLVMHFKGGKPVSWIKGGDNKKRASMPREDTLMPFEIRGKSG